MPGATASVDEFFAARALFTELHTDARWNPWVFEDPAAELDRTLDVMEQWTRAEPGFRQLAGKQMDARLGSDRLCYGRVLLCVRT